MGGCTATAVEWHFPGGLIRRQPDIPSAAVPTVWAGQGLKAPTPGQIKPGSSVRVPTSKGKALNVMRLTFFGGR